MKNEETVCLKEKPQLTNDKIGKTAKYLVFKLDGINYGISILVVSEIISLTKITPIPHSPECLKGVINLRGKIIPTIDLRLKLDMAEKEYDEKTCIVIVNLGNQNSQNQLVGIIVDIVSEVLDLPFSEIENPEENGLDEKSNFLDGIGKTKESIIMLLNVASIVSFKELENYINTKA